MGSEMCIRDRQCRRGSEMLRVRADGPTMQTVRQCRREVRDGPTMQTGDVLHVGRDDWHRSPQTNNGAEIEIVLPKAERAGEAGIPTKPKPETRTKPSGKMGETRNPDAAEKRNPKPKPGRNPAGGRSCLQVQTSLAHACRRPDIHMGPWQYRFPPKVTSVAPRRRNQRSA